MPSDREPLQTVGRSGDASICRSLPKVSGAFNPFRVPRVAGAVSIAAATLALTPSALPQNPNLRPSTAAAPAAGQSFAAVPASAMPTTAVPGAVESPDFAKPVRSFRDPRTGVVYDVYAQTQSVPVPRYEWEEVTVTQLVPTTVTENLQTTQVQYVPVVSYETQPKLVGRWNPFVTPQQTNQYTPVVRYQPQNKVVTTPVTYQKYVPQQVKMRVPKLVQSTESRVQYVERPRSASAVATAATNFQTTPVQMVALAAPAPTAALPTAAPHNPALQTAAVPTYTGQPMAAVPTVANQQMAALPSYPMPQAVVPMAASGSPASWKPQWPQWLTAKGPIFGSSLFKEDRSLAAPPMPAGSVAGNWLSTSPPAAAPPRQFTTAAVSGSRAVRPTTSAAHAATAPRTAAQGGVPTTVLR